MTTQVQGLITPTYEPVIEVAEDGEVLTEAILINTAVSLGNRIEFVKENVDNVADAPERFFILREEFIGAVYDGGGSTLYADNVWRTAVDFGSPVINGRGGTSRRPGQLECSMPPTSEFSFGLHSALTSPVAFLTVQHLTVVVRVNDHVDNIASSMTVGIKEDWSVSNGGDDSVMLFYNKAIPNWNLVVRKGGVQVTHDLGVPVVQGEFVTFRLLKNGNDIDVELDGDIVHTVLAADRPTGEANIGATVTSSAAETEMFTVNFDFFFCRASTSTTRSGA